MKHKLSFEGSLLMRGLLPFAKIVCGLTFIFSNIFVIVQSYTYLKALLFIGAVEVISLVICIVVIYSFVKLLDMKRQKKEKASVN